ncbi:MAG: energy-coupling factor ABC transporter permease, partial [Planctomycetes bacterium]|nr:energy-coupling factor ABC transporter permease [Planctomycetota bacterium]
MHIPDGVLSTEVCVATGVVSAGAVGYSLHRMKTALADRTIPLTGMMAALVFAGQMVNFPLGVVPVSGHLLGGVLSAAVLGPWAACVAMTMVLVVQCILFADGGLMALGANVLHMAVVGGLGGYAVYVVIRRWLGGGARG